MNVFGGALQVPGRGQMRGIVAAVSQRAAADATGQTIGAIRTYWSLTGNPVELSVALAQPGVVFVAPLSTARSAEDYRPRDPVTTARPSTTTGATMSSIESAAVGDKLAVIERIPTWGDAPHVKHALYVITKTTATQAVAVKEGSPVEKRFRRKDGAEIGATSRFGTGAVLLTPALLAEHETQKAARARWDAITKRFAPVEQAIKMRALSIEQMDAIATAFETTGETS